MKFSFHHLMQSSVFLQAKEEQIFMLGNNEKLLLVWQEYIPLIELYQVLDIPQGKNRLMKVLL
ncbi:MAG: hypothetical protein AB8V50_09625 [Arsenophonus endosymbiont of Dermacentor nuttalli]